jgi:hypothetical protein
MKLMNGIAFTSKELVEIINAAKESNLKSIQYAGLCLEFDTNFHPNKSISNAAHMDVLSVGEEGQPPGPNHFADEPTVNDDQLMLSEMADLLSIEDPASFEELQLKLMSEKQGQS